MGLAGAWGACTRGRAGLHVLRVSPQPVLLVQRGPGLAWQGGARGLAGA